VTDAIRRHPWRTAAAVLALLFVLWLVFGVWGHATGSSY